MEQIANLAILLLGFATFFMLLHEQNMRNVRNVIQNLVWQRYYL